VRFNSWDALLHPIRVAHVIRYQLDNPLQQPLMLAALAALTAFLFVGYVVIYAFAGARLELERSP
jgi:uncharacterized membrane protein